MQYFGKLSDDLDLCIEIVSKALQEVDILLTTGGVSVGDYDYLPAIYQAIQADVLFNKVAMRPGSVTTVAAAMDNYYLGFLAIHQRVMLALSFLYVRLFVVPLVIHSHIYVENKQY